jgi:iron complex transport system permease protein
MLADTFARTAFAPREVPVGLVTAIIGGPFFLWQLQRGFR